MDCGMIGRQSWVSREQCLGRPACMGVNCNKPQRWKRDIALSVDLYNAWFLEFAPNTYREERSAGDRERGGHAGANGIPS